MTVNLYDLLEIPESADEQEIRAAWKLAIADLDPTERRFKVFNDAAAVLLDPDKKAAHDADLARARDAEEAADAAEARSDAEAATKATGAATKADDPAADGTDAVLSEPEESAKSEEPARARKKDESATSADTDGTTARPVSAGPPGWAVGAAAVGALLAVVLAIYLLAQPGGRLFGSDSPRDIDARNASAERTTLAAEGAAEAMVAPVLSYNHATMAADLERLEGYLTPAMLKKQTAAWPALTAEAVKQEIVVEATATATALTRLSDDGERATVVVFIDQLVKKAATEPFALHMWATMELVRKGSGTGATWLLDDLCTDASCG